MDRDRRFAAELGLGVERNEPAVALLHGDLHVLGGGVVEARDRADPRGQVDAERVGRFRRGVHLAGGEQRLEELAAIVALPLGLDVEHLVVADGGRDLEMGQAVDREVGEVELLEALMGVERDAAANVDIVAEDLEVFEHGGAVLLRHDVDIDGRGVAHRLGPAQAAELELRAR